MPRITKSQLKESIVPFAIDVLKIIKEKIDIYDDMKDTLHTEWIENGWYYHLHTNIFRDYRNDNPFLEIIIKRRNYQCIDKKSKGTHIYESCWVYKEGENCIGSKDIGYKIDGFSIYDYKKKVF